MFLQGLVLPEVEVPEDVHLPPEVQTRHRNGRALAAESIDRLLRVAWNQRPGVPSAQMDHIRAQVDPYDLAELAWAVHEGCARELDQPDAAWELLAHFGDEGTALRLAERHRTAATAAPTTLLATLAQMQASSRAGWLADLAGRARNRDTRHVAARFLRRFPKRERLPQPSCAVPLDGMLQPTRPPATRAEHQQLDVIEGMSGWLSAALERDLVAGRTWNPAGFERHLGHRVFSALARRLLWTDHTRGGPRTFRLVEDGRPHDQWDQPYVPQRSIRLAHPAELSPEDLRAWQDQFEDHQLLQPFDQLFRPRLHTPAHQVDSRELRVSRRVQQADLDALVDQGWRWDFSHGGMASLDFPNVSRVRIYLVFADLKTAAHTTVTVLRIGPRATRRGPTLGELPLRLQSELLRVHRDLLRVGTPPS